MFTRRFLPAQPCLRLLLGLLLCLGVHLPGHAQFAPTLRWDRTLGGNADDALSSLEPTAHGGYLLGGWSRSGASGDKTRPSQGRTASWVVQVDSDGVLQWERSYGTRSADDETLTRAVPTPDGGYLLAGSAYAGASGDKSAPGRGGLDFWVIKLDARGTKQWDRAYGGSEGDGLTAVQLTPDGGFVLAGFSSSGISGDKTQASRGIFDLWVLKADAQGNPQWDRTIGGAGNDGPSSLLLTADGGYLLGGTSDSGVSGDKSQPGRGGFDYWLVKLGAQGQLQWDRTFGGAAEDQLLALCATPDGGYVLAGASASGAAADKTQPARGLRDFWLIKTDGLGQRQWDATVGGNGDDWASTVLVAADGGYLVGGFSESGVSGERTRPSRGGRDGWVVKLNPGGGVVWDQAVGGSANDAVVRLLQAPGGDLVVGATSESGVSGDKTQPSKGLVDYWLVRLQAPRISGDAQLCGSGQVQLAAPPGAAYRWSTGATSQTITVGQPGTYSVVVTGSAGDTLTLRHRVTAFVPPSLVLSGDTVLCAGRHGQVAVAAPGATGYRWSTGETTAAIAVGQPATYTVTAFFGSGCSRQAAVRVRAQPALPPLSLGADTVLCEGQALALRVAGAPAGGIAYRWSDNSTAPTLRVQHSGHYSVQLTSACETRTLTRQVLATPCLTLPTIITPNADHRNDCWAVQGLTGDGWELELFSRWGQRVYHTANYHNEWGAGAAAGLYYYLLRHAASNTVRNGWVEVVR